MTDLTPRSLGDLPDPADSGMTARRQMELAQACHPRRRAAMESAAAMAAVRESVARDGGLAERELRPLGETLPGWYAYRGPDRHSGTNLQQTLIAMRESVVRRRLGHLPSRPVLVLTGPTPEES